MTLLGTPGNGVLLPFRRGNALVSPPVGFPGCVCCPRYDCLPGTVECQSCVWDRNGPYKTLTECNPQCPPLTCIWCVEVDETGPCGEEYVSYTCVGTGCDPEGICENPGLPVVAGPVRVDAPLDVDCDDVCPPDPPPPPEQECCDYTDCPCCYTCINGVCVGCPPGTVCIDCECVPIEDAYYCCKEPDVYGEPPNEPYCQLGPCAPPAETVGGPYEDYTGCCETCGDESCGYDCDPVGYRCIPDPLGPYERLGQCEDECLPPEEDGACCYTIAPYSEDNETESPEEGCALVKGCFGIMSFAACEALATETGTSTTWYADYDTCDLCPVTQSRPCCYDDPANPCVTLCVETDESCCDAIEGTLYTALTDCQDEWESGLSACRDDLPCAWPDPNGETYFEQVFKERSYAYSPPPPRPLNADPPCIQAPRWNTGWPPKLEECDEWRWIREESRCDTPNINNVRFGKTCVRYRLLIKKGNQITDITSQAVSNMAGMECCACTLAGSWSVCAGTECTPLEYLAFPEANCPP